MSERLDVAYYYPAPYWGMNEGGWVKSLLLFFDKVSILLPGLYVRATSLRRPRVGRAARRPGLARGAGTPKWIDQDMAKKLAEGVSGLLANGVFDDLSKDVHFHELSQSRLGYGADVKLADSLVSELRAKELAKPSEDGVSIPLQPTVRTTILVILDFLVKSHGRGYWK